MKRGPKFRRVGYATVIKMIYTPDFQKSMERIPHGNQQYVRIEGVLPDGRCRYMDMHAVENVLKFSLAPINRIFCTNDEYRMATIG